MRTLGKWLAIAVGIYLAIAVIMNAAVEPARHEKEARHTLDALLRWPVPQARLAGSRGIHSPERVPQEIELLSR
jgi:hypothetical protein